MQVTITPIVIGAFGTVTKGLLKGLEDLEVGGRVETIQTTALLRTARILRRVVETCCHSDSSEKPSANADVRSSNEWIIITIIYNQDKGMEIRMEKRVMLIMSSRKRQFTEGIKKKSEP